MAIANDIGLDLTPEGRAAMDRLNELSSVTIEVGYQADQKAADDETSLAEVAYWNHYGTLHKDGSVMIPARPFIPNVAGSTAYTSNWVAELFGPSNLKKSTSGFPQRLYNSVLQGALGIDKDGIFGANTEKTVKEFQSAHGLTADGIAGAKTKVALAKQL